MKKPTSVRVWATPETGSSEPNKTDSKGAAAIESFLCFPFAAAPFLRPGIQVRCVRRSLASAGTMHGIIELHHVDVVLPDPIDPEIIFRKALVYKIIFSRTRRDAALRGITLASIRWSLSSSKA